MEHLDNTTKISRRSIGYLNEIAKWANIMAILGFIISGLIVISGIFMLLGGFTSSRYFENMGGPILGSAVAGIGLMYIFIALLYFFPCLYLYQYSTYFKSCLQQNNWDNLDFAFEKLKSFFKFVGLITLAILIFYGAIILFALLGGGIGYLMN